MKRKFEDPPVMFSTVYAENVPWNELEETPVKDRLKIDASNMEILKSILSANGEEACPSLENNGKNPMYLAGRMGSQQRSSNVFRIKFQKREGSMVLKILPYSNYDTDPPDPDGEKSKREVQIAFLASEAVRAGNTTYFPLVYGHGPCDKVILPPPSSDAPPPDQMLYVQAQNWARNRALIEQYVRPSDIPRAVEWAKGKDPKDVIGLINQHFPEATIPTYAPIRAELILMERAWGDLSMYLSRAESVGKEEMRKLILHCLYAILHLQEKLKIKHQDLKPENILIQKIEDKDGTVRPWPLIADFGNAVEFNGLGGRDEKLHDVKTLFDALSRKPSKLRARIDRMGFLINYPHLNTYSYGTHPIYTMKDVIDYWKMSPKKFMEAFKIDEKYVYTMNKLEGNWGDLGKEGLGEFGERGKEGDDRLARFLL